MGPVVFYEHETGLDIGGPKPRAVLAVLALSAGQVIPTDRLIDLVWDEPPATARRTLQSYLARIRRVCDDDPPLRTVPGGVVLSIDREAVDLLRFEDAVSRALLPDGPDISLAELERELSGWATPAIDAHRSQGFDALFAPYTTLHLQAVEQLARLQIAAGQSDLAVPSLEGLARRHPTRESVWELLGRAHLICGRTDVAHQVVQQAREALRNELGVGPSPLLLAFERELIDNVPHVAHASTGAEAVDTPISNRQATSTQPVETAEPFLAAVMFTDLVGSTALSNDIGQDHYDRVRSVHQQILRDACEAENVLLLKFEGDGVMAVFRSATDALRAASGIQQRVERQRLTGDDTADARVQVRIGMAAGDVLLKSTDADGLAVVEAARLCDAATADQVLCHELISTVVAGRAQFVFGDVTDVAGKGLASPLPARPLDWSPQRPLLHGFPERLAGRPDFEFAGRVDERRQLRDLNRRAADGTTSYVAIVGEPGAGKTRLAAEAAKDAYASGSEVWYGRCDRHHGRPYQPFAEAMEHYVRSHGVLTETASLDARLAPLLATAERTALGVTETGPISSLAAVAQLHEAAITWLQLASGNRPVFFVIDDLNWADSGSLELVRHVMNHAPQLRLAIVSTYRNDPADVGGEEVLATLGDLARRSRNLEIELSGLSPEETLAMLGGSNEAAVRHADEAFAEHLRDLTDGSPFFIEDTVDWLEQCGLLEAALTGDWPTISGSSASVSRRIAAIAEQRLLLVADAGREVIRTAALRGLAFDSSVVTAAADVVGPPEAGPIEQARRAGIIEDNDDPTFDFRFRHDLVREALLVDVGAARQRRWHRRLGEAIVAIHHDHLDEHAASAARHLRLSRDAAVAGRAIELYRRAARRALDTAASESANELLDEAVALADLIHLDQGLRAELEFLRGLAQKRSGRGDARRTLLRAGAMSDAAGRPDLVIASAIASSRGLFSLVGRVDDELVGQLRRALELTEPDDDGSRASLLAALSQELTFASDGEQANTMSAEALELARGTDDPRTVLRAINARHSVVWHPAGLPERQRLIEEWERLARSIDDAGWEASAASFGVQVAMEMGDMDRARQRLGRLRELDEVLSQGPLRSYTMLWRAVVATVEGDLDDAERLADRTRELNAAIGNSDGEAWYMGQMYPVRWHQGRLDELEESFEVAYAFVPDLPVLGAALANIQAELGKFDRARETLVGPLEAVERRPAHIDQLVTLACLVRTVGALGEESLARRLLPMFEGHLDQHICNGSVHFGSPHHYVAMLEAISGGVDAADRSFSMAHQANERLGAPLLVAQTEIAWAEALQSTASPARDRIRVLAESAGKRADELSAYGIVERSKAVLDLAG